MRIRLRLLLPLLVGLLVAAGFLLAGVLIGDAVRGSLTTVAGVTRERAVEEALRVVAIAGVMTTALAILASYLLARLIARPILAIHRSAPQLAEGGVPAEPRTPLAEIRDMGRGLRRAAVELGERHDRVLRQQAELAELVEAVAEGIIQVDGEGRLVRANRASLRLLGLPDEPLGQPLALLLRDRALRRIVARSLAGEGSLTAEVSVDDRRLLATVSPRPEGGALATFADLTELRRLEEVRRDFVANASHELKTPLTSIRGYSDTLLHGDLPDAERRQFIDTIARNARRLQRIVDDLLDLSRLEAGRWQPDLEPLHVLEVAADCWAGLPERDPAPTVRFEIDETTDDRVLADRQALEQVFVNLYDNALRHTPEDGAIRVRVPVDPVDPPPGAAAGARPLAREPTHDGSGAPGRTGWVVVEISDTGSGIPRDALPRIFERFYRVDPARSRAEGGTGLGLSIVRHMIESMGGEVTAESVLGKGTTIRLRLPRA